MSEVPHPHAVFWIELSKISPNPYQPRKYFDEQKLQDLSGSIRRYGVLQPIVVTRSEEFTEDGGMTAKYEIIAGERRFRASQMAGLEKIPAIIREGEQTDKEKLELAILENLQREDLNPVDKARSFNRLVEEFSLTHAEVAERLGKSREYVSNSMRLLQLPEHILQALSEGKISEGHTRPLLMLKERPDEQQTLYLQMTQGSGITVRDAEKFARAIATEKQRKNKDLDPEMKEIQQKLASHLGTRVVIDKKSQGGKLTIEFGNRDDLRQLLEKFEKEETQTKITESQSAIPQEAKPDIAPAYSAAPERTVVSQDRATAPQPQPTIASSEPAIHKPLNSLQQEIDALASQAKPDSFAETTTQQSQTYQPQEPQLTTPTPEPATPVDKFAFQTEQQLRDDPKLHPEFESLAQVDVVSDNSFETFAKQDYPDPVATTDSVSVGDDFVPGYTPVEPRAFGTMTSDTVNKKSPDQDGSGDDLYNLKNFSL